MCEFVVPYFQYTRMFLIRSIIIFERGKKIMEGEASFTKSHCNAWHLCRSRGAGGEAPALAKQRKLPPRTDR